MASENTAPPRAQGGVLPPGSTVLDREGGCEIVMPVGFFDRIASRALTVTCLPNGQSPVGALAALRRAER